MTRTKDRRMSGFDFDAEIDVLLSLYARSKADVCRGRPLCNTLCRSALSCANPPPPSKFVRKSKPATNKIIDLHTQRTSTGQNSLIEDAVDSQNHINSMDKPVHGSLDFDLLYSLVVIGRPGALSTSADLNSKDK